MPDRSCGLLSLARDDRLSTLGGRFPIHRWIRHMPGTTRNCGTRRPVSTQTGPSPRDVPSMVRACAGCFVGFPHEGHATTAGPGVECRLSKPVRRESGPPGTSRKNRATGRPGPESAAQVHEGRSAGSHLAAPSPIGPPRVVRAAATLTQGVRTHATISAQHSRSTSPRSRQRIHRRTDYQTDRP